MFWAILVKSVTGRCSLFGQLILLKQTLTEVFMWPICHFYLTHHTSDGRYKFTWNHFGKQHESFIGEEACFGAVVITVEVRLASQPVRQDTSVTAEQQTMFYLGGGIDDGNIIPILKGSSNSNSTNSQKQGPAGELENRRE